jgi:hypothetical protein
MTGVAIRYCSTRGVRLQRRQLCRWLSSSHNDDQAPTSAGAVVARRAHQRVSDVRGAQLDVAVGPSALVGRCSPQARSVMSNRKLAVVLSLTLALMALSVSAAEARRAQLQYVVDGDTVRLRSDQYVRFIGVDAPESSKCGGRASERVMNRLVEGSA